MIIQIVKFQVLTVKRHYIAPSTLNCKHHTVIEDQVYVGCISPIEKNFQLCVFDYIRESLSQCINYNLDWDLDDLIEWKYLGFNFEAIVSMAGTKIFVVALDYTGEKYKDEININRFIVLGDQGNTVIQLPVPKLSIKKMKIVVFNEPKSHLQLLAGIKNGNLMDLVSFRLKDLILDRKSLREGLIKEAINDFHANSDRIVTFKLVSMTNTLIITLLEINELNTKEIIIENQYSLISTEMTSNFLTVKTRNTKLVQQTYIYDIPNARLFLWDREWKFNQAHSFMMKFENRNFFFEIDYENWREGFKYFVTRIRPFDMITITFNQEFYTNERWKEAFVRYDEHKQKMIEGEIIFKSGDINSIKMILRFVDDTFYLNKFNTERIEGRIWIQDSVYMMIYGNNLPIDPSDETILYFNEIMFDKKQLVDIMANDSILSTFLFRYGNYITKNGYYYYFNYDLPLSSKAHSIEYNKIKIAKFSENYDFDKLDLKRIQQAIIYSAFLVFIIDETKLYYFSYEFTFPDEDEELMTDLQLPPNRICSLMNNLVFCRYDPKTAHLRLESDGHGRLFFQLKPLDNGLVLEEIYTFVPNMDFLLGPLTFYYSAFTDGYFSLAQKGVRYYELLEAGPNGVLQITELPFINEENRDFIHMEQLMSGVALFIVYHQGLSVWVIKNRRVYDYPDKEYLMNYKE